MLKQVTTVFILFLGVSIKSVRCGFTETGLMLTTEGPIVETVSGKVQGRRDTLYTMPGVTVDSFFGIPYAKPPVGDLRFKRAVATEAWTDVKDATKEPKSCPQVVAVTPGLEKWTVDEVSEDCLYLNVFLPKTLEEVQKEVAEGAELAVMTWIHGGGFYMGSSTLDVYDGRYLAAATNTIVVSMNYRLGALGFLNLKTDSIDTNIGLLDQNEALKWVRANIGKFGGNKHNVTIFGESAGAVSVGLHLLSEATSHKFQQAILQSGTPLNPWAVISNAESIRRSTDLAKKLECGQETVEEIVACLRGKTIEDITTNQEVVQGLLQFSFVPTVDGKYLKDTPENLLSSNKFTQRPVLAGSNKDEATFFLAFSLAEFLDPANPHMTQGEFVTAMRQSFYFYPRFPAAMTTEDFAKITAQYSPPEQYKDVLPFNFNAINNAVTDSGFICSMNKFLELYSVKDEVKTFSYLFTQRLTNGLFPEILGVPHASELLYTFASVLKYGKLASFTDEDILMSQQIVKFWSDFAKTSTPYSKDGTYPQWPRYDKSQQKYLELNQQFLNQRGKEEGKKAIECKLREKQCTFWDQITPKLEETVKK